MPAIYVALKYARKDSAAQLVSTRAPFGHFDLLGFAGGNFTRLGEFYPRHLQSPGLAELRARHKRAYRVWGGGSQKAGAWLSPIAPSSSAAAVSIKCSCGRFHGALRGILK